MRTTGAARSRELDGLRAIAVLAVAAFHYSLGTPLGSPWFNPFSRFGWAGVDLFFVLSGYLITGVLLDARVDARGRTGYFRHFYARRTRRIFPVYFLALACGIAAAWSYHHSQPWSYWLMQAAFLSSTLQFFHYWPLPAPQYVLAGVTVIWSLSIEEQFYLLWAPLVRWLRERGLAVVIAAVVVGAPLLRHAIHRGWFPEYYFFPARLDSLAWGAGLALYLRAHGRRPGLQWLGVAAIAVGLPLSLRAGSVLRADLDFATWGYTAIAAGCAAVIGLVVLAGPRPGAAWGWLGRGPLPYLGRISYCMYLVHYPILVLLRGHVSHTETALWPALWTAAIGLAATAGVAALSWHFLEAPLLGAREPVAPAVRTVSATAVPG